jgi:hypothetical protein
MTEFEPGWLMRTAHSAHIQCMMDHSPASLRHLCKHDEPIPEAEAKELYERMNARFREWTGVDLASMSHRGQQRE